MAIANKTTSEQAALQPCKTVFVVDDDEAAGAALERLLRSCGYSTKRWNSARAFLTDHDPSAPGCLVTDLMMPEMSGLELRRNLSSGVCPRETILLTASENVEYIPEGFMCVLRKPINKADLLRAVQSALTKDAAARAAIK